MLLLADRDPWLDAARAACAAMQARGAPVAIAPRAVRGRWAFGTVSDTDALDDAIDPAVDIAALSHALASALGPRGEDASHAHSLARAIAHREDAIDASTARRIAPPAWPERARPVTLFEHAALVDVLGAELASLMPIDRVEIDRAPIVGGAGANALNHCEMGRDGIARIRLLGTNGATLAGRTHALVHEMGHALIGLARAAGRSYACGYGQPDYGRFLDASSHATLCDEEALVRAIADAWLLRRPSVAWARTWPGAVDDVARDRNLDGADLAKFARFRLAQGLGLLSPV
jgi:hypothetical protein